MIPPEDYTIRLADLPPAAGGFVSESPDGHLNVYVNARLSRDGQREAADHELWHIENDDLHNGRSIAEVEAAADGLAPGQPRGLPPLMRARDLPRPAPKRAQRVVVPDPDPAPAAAVVIPMERSWAQDIFHRLPWLD